jgi:hypothetical protein
MTKGLRCQHCATPLTGRQKRWCSQSCAAQGWEIEHRSKRREIVQRWLDSKRLPPDQKGVIRINAETLHRVEAKYPEVGLAFREAVADIRYIARAS